MVDVHLPAVLPGGGGLLFFSSVRDESTLIPAQHAKEGYWIYVENHKQIVQLVKQLGGGGGGGGGNMWPDAEVIDTGNDDPPQGGNS